MRLAWFVLAAVAVGCSGGDKSTSESGSPTGDDDDDDLPSTPCDAVPYFDPDGMSCDELGSAWEQLIGSAKACETDDDCSIVKPACEHWAEVDCWYTYNKNCVDASTLAAFSAEATERECITSTGQVGVCKCGAAPDVLCGSDHRCCSPEIDFGCSH